MLAANVCTAQFLAQHKHPALYRVHEGPTPEKLSALRDFLASCALSLPGGDDPTASDYAKLLLKIKDRPDYALLQTVLLRSLQQARYRPDNVGHFGLSYEAYAFHVAYSPVSGSVGAPRDQGSAGKARVQAVGLVMGRARRPLLAHRTSCRRRDARRQLAQVLLHAGQVGETFDGTISGVTSFGIFVTLDGLNIDGLVHVTELGRDYFHFDAARHAMVGERSGRVFQLAGRIRIKVARVDLETTKIDFTLADDIGRATSEVAPPRKYSEPLVRSDPPRKPKARR
jgi:ribonuclease R